MDSEVCNTTKEDRTDEKPQKSKFIAIYHSTMVMVACLGQDRANFNAQIRTNLYIPFVGSSIDHQFA